MFNRAARIAALLALFLAWPAISSAATIAQVLGNPSSYDGQHVELNGTVERVKQKVSHRGNPYVTFSLCSNQCIHVFAFGSPSISEGQTITVRGTFAAVKHVGSYTFYNELDADDGSL